jgi:hypothetical protein
MSTPRIAGLLTAFTFILVVLSAVLGSALLGVSHLSDWTLIAAQVCIWLAVSIFLGYFFAGCAAEIRNIR